MKRLGLIWTALLVPLTASGDDNWVQLHGNIYKYNVDGWVYRVSGDKCCGYKYYKLYKFPVVSLNVKAEDFETRLADNISREEIQGRREQLLRDAYPEHFTALQGGAQYASATTGFKISQQGYGLVNSGSTLWANAAYQAQPYRTDIGPLIREAQRLAAHTMGLTVQATSGANQLVGQVIEGDTAVARIRAAGEVTVAAVQAAQPPITTVEGTQTLPYQTQQQPQYQPQYQQQAQPYDQGQPAPPDQGSVFRQQGIDDNPQKLRGYAQVGFGTCAKCHTGAAPKADLLLTEEAFAAISPAERQQLAQAVDQATDPNKTPANKLMPKGGKALPVSIRKAMTWLILHPKGAGAYDPPPQQPPLGPAEYDQQSVPPAPTPPQNFNQVPPQPTGT